jgi:hypothetical protein
MDRISDALIQRYLDEPGFWDGCSIADLQLVRLLDRRFAARSKAWSGDDDKQIAAIQNLYLDPIRRGASAREISSITENIDFIVAMLNPSAASLACALSKMSKGLTG